MEGAKPMSFAETGFMPKATKLTRKEAFLSERERVAP